MRFFFVLLAIVSSFSHAAEEYRFGFAGEPDVECMGSTSSCWADLYAEVDEFFTSKGWWTASSGGVRGRHLLTCEQCTAAYGGLCWFYCRTCCTRRRLIGETMEEFQRRVQEEEALEAAEEQKEQEERNMLLGLLFGSNDPIGECSPEDCDRDSDCADGLLCSDDHGAELMKMGWDKRKAYCGNIGSYFSEHCYDPKKLDPAEISPESEWKMVSGAETMEFVKEMRTLLRTNYPDIDRLQIIIQKRTV